jgi:hypothetical protein
MIGYGNSYFISTILDTESGVPPVNTVAPAITGTAQEGQIVTCSTGTWTGTPTITFAYQWKRNGSNIGSATNSTYTLVTADVSQSITCQVTATNGSGSASATSNTITPIAAVDPDAQAFITAAAITNPTQQAAINTLVVDLKGYGVWTKASMIHPYVGGTSTSTSFNLKNTSQFQISWVGGWTWDANGVKGNGLNSYGNTGFNFSTQITSVNIFSAALYTNQYITGGIDFGADNNSNWYLAVKTSVFGTNLGAFAAAGVGTYSDTTGLGFYTAVKRTNPTPGFSNNDIYKNGSLVVSAANTSGTLYNGNVYIGGLNRNGSLLLPTNIRYAFSAIFNASLTATEAANLRTAVQAFQTTLGRQV